MVGRGEGVQLRVHRDRIGEGDGPAAAQPEMPRLPRAAARQLEVHAAERLGIAARLHDQRPGGPVRLHQRGVRVAQDEHVHAL